VISSVEALERLRAGNARFVAETRRSPAQIGESRRAEVAEGQNPFAIIHGCSDSRVPAELIFDQGLGDLFVIRVAGNIVAASQVGSIEFAAEKFETRLVVVIGHTQCGAIGATLQELQEESATGSPNLQFIVDKVRPSVEPLLATDLKNDPVALYREAVRANIRQSVDQLRHGSEILENLIKNKGLAIIGAEYSLETGEVEFFDDEGLSRTADGTLTTPG
jgi:carbonic anhydrase